MIGTRTREVDLVLIPMFFSAGLAVVVAGPFSTTEPWPLVQQVAGWALVAGGALAFIFMRFRARSDDASEVVPEEQMRALYACLTGSCDEGEHIGLALFGQDRTTEGVTPDVMERASKAISDWGFATKVVVMSFFYDRSVVSTFLRSVFPMTDSQPTWADLQGRVEAGLVELRRIRDTMETRQVRMDRKVEDWSRYSRREGQRIF